MCKGIPSKIDLYALTNLIQRCLAHGNVDPRSTGDTRL